MAKNFGVKFSIGASLGASVASAFASVQDKLRATQAAFSSASNRARQLGNVLAARNRLEALQSKMRAEGATAADLVNVRRLAEAYARAAKQAGVYGQSLAQIQRQQEQFSEAAMRSQRSMAALQTVQRGREIRSEASEQRKGAIGNFVADVAPMLAVAAPLKIGADFDAAMSKVASISQAMGADLEALRQQARELGATTVWSAKEAAEGMTFLSMAGFKTKETMAAMPGMLNLASAGGMGLAETADIASNILSGFQMKAEQMGYVADVLAKTFTSSNTSIASLGESMKYAAPAAVLTGQSFQDMAAMVGKLGDAGVQGSMAGTALNAMLVRLSAPPKEAEAALNQLGISIKDAAGNMRAMPDILAELEAKTAGMGNVAKTSYFSKIFGLENAKSGAILAAQAFSGELQKLSRNLDDKGFAEQLAKQQTDNLAGDLKGLQSASQEVAICLFDALNPALRTITQNVTPIVQGIGQWIAANPRLSQGLTLLAGAFVGLKAAGLAFTLINSYRRTFVGGLVSLQGQAMRPLAAVRNGFSSLRLELARPVGNPFRSVAAGATNFAARLTGLRSAVGQTIARMRQITPASIAAGAAARASGAAAAVGRAGWNTLRLGVSGVGMAFKTMFGPMSMLMMGMGFAADYIIEHWDKIAPYFQALWDGVKNIFNAALEWLRPLADKISSFIAPILDGVKSIGGIIGKGWDFLFGESGEDKARKKARNEELARKKAAQEALPVKTQEQLAREARWKEQYAGYDFDEKQEEDKQARKAAREAEKQREKAARKGIAVQPAQAVAAPASAAPRRAGSGAAAGAGTRAAPQVNVAVNITQNGVPDQTFAQGVITAIKNRQSELEAIISGIVRQQARLAYG